MSKSKLQRDTWQALQAWRVWVFLGRQDIQARFRRSLLGPLWLVLNTSIFVAGAGLVYGALFSLSLGEFLPMLTVGIVVWGFIVASLTESANAFVVAEGYIKQFPYPKQIYLLRTLVVHATVLAIGLSILLALQLLLGRFHLWAWLLALPGLLILLITALAHITALAYLGARFRDLPHAASGALQVVFFITPVMFPARLLDDKNLSIIYQVNPLFYMLEIVRFPLLNNAPVAPQIYGAALVYSAIAWVIAILVARRMDARLVFTL